MTTHKTVTPKPPRGLLAVLAFGAFLVGMDAMLVSTLIPAMTASVHVASHSGGLFVTMYALAYGLSSPLFGPIADHFHRQTMFLIGLVVFGLSTMLTGWARSFDELLVFRAMTGIGGAIIIPTIFALVADMVPFEQRGQVMGIVTGSLWSASVIGVPIGSFLTYGTTWRTPFWVVGTLDNHSGRRRPQNCDKIPITATADRKDYVGGNLSPSVSVRSEGILDLLGLVLIIFMDGGIIRHVRLHRRLLHAQFSFKRRRSWPHYHDLRSRKHAGEYLGWPMVR